MNTNKKVRLSDFLSCLDPSADVVVWVNGNKSPYTLVEDQVSFAANFSIPGTVFDFDLYSVVDCRYSVIEFRFQIRVIKVEESQDE